MRFGAFELDLKAGELRNGGALTRLQGQPFEILLMLAESAGETVSREEIRRKLWPNDTVVEFDHSISSAIKRLRQALGDSADNPSYIETVGRRGYRLMVAVDWGSAGDDISAASDVMGHESMKRGVRLEIAGLIGKKVSHYRVLEVIGGGGMGLVYKAEDLKLGRRVALKFLPEEWAGDPVALQRFEREARTASSLNHPNICTIYEVEEHETQPFLVMELLSGETLRDRLARAAAEGNRIPLAELLSIAIQVADGLEAAHEQGIIHRDIKPANLVITSKGVIKILDFGLAKLLEGDSGPLDEQPGGRSLATGDTALSLTHSSIAAGTAGYMSPEQIRREKLDTRTDLFSFGLVLYEMASGQRAFRGETAAILKDAILHQEPIFGHVVNASVPAELEKIIRKAIEKDREKRYKSASEMQADMNRLAGKQPRRPASYKATPKMRLVAAVLVLLAVSSLLLLLRHQGRGQGKQSRITATSAAIFNSGSARELDQRVQNEYLQGKALFQNRDRESLVKAIEHFENALRYDPNYAPAIAALANCYIVAPFFASTVGGNSYAKARAAAQQALSLDESLADAHLAKAEVRFYGDWDFAGAAEEFKRAIELGPEEAITHQWYAEFLSLMSRHPEAIAEIEEALRIEPMSAVIHHQAGQVYQSARMYEKALDQYNLALKINPQFAASYDRMAYAFRRLGRIPEAIEAERRAANYWDPSGASAQAIDGWAEAYAKAGKEAYDRARLQWDKVSPSPSPLYYTAMKYAELGDKGNSLVSLHKALESRSSDLLNLRNDPEFDFMHFDPEFQAVLKEIGFSPIKTGEQ